MSKTKATFFVLALVSVSAYISNKITLKLVEMGMGEMLTKEEVLDTYTTAKETLKDLKK